MCCVHKCTVTGVHPWYLCTAYCIAASGNTCMLESAEHASSSNVLIENSMESVPMEHASISQCVKRALFLVPSTWHPIRFQYLVYI